VSPLLITLVDGALADPSLRLFLAFVADGAMLSYEDLTERRTSGHQ
jgi:hypothetical protein